VPRLLLSPPWTRKPPARVTVTPSPLAAEPRVAWRDGERDEWSHDWKDFLSEEMRKHLPLAETGDAPTEFYISAPADIVRPRLARWKAESAWFYLQSPRVIVGKYELYALAPILQQTIVELTFESSRSELGVFSDLPMVARSELIRSLRTLG
jgi:hypothetical protein